MGSSAPVVSQSPKGKIELSTGSGGLVLKISGVIDEDLSFAPIIKALETQVKPGTKIVAELSGVTRMNSCGVRDWILLLDRTLAVAALEFNSVSAILIEQANMIPNLLGKKGTPLHSFDAPYFCPACNKEVTATIKPSEVNVAAPQAPARKCPKCTAALSFDWNEAEFFSFLKNK